MKTITVQITEVGIRHWKVHVNGQVVAECAARIIAEKYVAVIKIVAQMSGAEVREIK